jgi:lipopolysaccharide biosynthesis glycosyltransferase
VVTNRDVKDESLVYLLNRIPNHEVYFKETFQDLISRCKYLIHSVDIDSDADYLLKMDLDVIPLKSLDSLYEILDGSDVYIQMENRRVIPDDVMEKRIWRQVYKAMEFKVPDIKMSYVENTEIGFPLFNTGVFLLRTSKLKQASENWSKLTKVCENWIQFNLHPNEAALTAMIFNYHWKLNMLPKRFNFNPISTFRKGEFPSTELKEDCKIPEDTVLLHYHKAKWLRHLMRYNKGLNDSLKGLNYLESLWNTSEEVYQEKF